jgi:hypothetical protein
VIGTFIACVTLFSLFGLPVGVVWVSGNARARRRARIAPHSSRATTSAKRACAADCGAHARWMEVVVAGFTR